MAETNVYLEKNKVLFEGTWNSSNSQDVSIPTGEANKYRLFSVYVTADGLDVEIPCYINEGGWLTGLSGTMIDDLFFGSVRIKTNIYDVSGGGGWVLYHARICAFNDKLEPTKLITDGAIERIVGIM